MGSRQPDDDALLRIRKPWAQTARALGAASIDVARALAGSLSFEQVAANLVVRAPNAGRPERVVAGEWRVRAGSPQASLSFAVALATPQAALPRRVVLLHGIRDSKRAIAGWAELFSRGGHEVVLVDLRGHGASTGDVLSYGLREAVDCARVLDAVDARLGPRPRVGVLGFSYGAAVALQWAAVDARIGAVVAVAPFASLPDVVRTYLPVAFPRGFVDRVLERVARDGQFDPAAASPERAIVRAEAPALLIHGTRDERIPFAHAARIHAARPHRTELVAIPEARHVGVVTHRETQLVTRASAWFARHL